MDSVRGPRSEVCASCPRTGLYRSQQYAGGEPTANYDNNAWKRKFTLAHEYGHLQTLIVPISSFSNDDVDFCYQDSDCTLNHNPESREWQAGAVIEAYADFYAMYTWNDLDDHPEGVMSWNTGIDAWKCRYRANNNNPGPTDCTENILPDFPVIADSWLYSGYCDPDTCPSGVALQSDWAFALWDMLGFQPGVTLKTLINIHQLAYPWPVNGEDQDYWNNFLNAAAIELNNNQLQAWLGVAEIRGIDH